MRIDQNEQDQTSIIPKSKKFRLGDTMFTFNPEGSQYKDQKNEKMITRERATLTALPLGSRIAFYLNAATVKDIASLAESHNFIGIYSLAVPEIPEDVYATES